MHVGICHQVTLPGTWEEAIDAAGTLGVAGIELFVRPDDVPGFLEAPEIARALKARAEKLGMDIRSLCLTFLMRGEARLADTSEDGRQRAVGMASAAIDRCADVNGKVVLIGGAPPPDDAAANDAYVRSVQTLAVRASGHGVRIGVESGLTGAQVQTLLGRIGQPAVVGNYFDLGNAANGGMDPATEIRSRAQSIVQIHVKGVRAAPHDAASVDLHAVSQALVEIGYDGWLMLETSAGEDAMGNARRNLAILREKRLA